MKMFYIESSRKAKVIAPSDNTKVTFLTIFLVSFISHWAHGFFGGIVLDFTHGKVLIHMIYFALSFLAYVLAYINFRRKKLTGDAKDKFEQWNAFARFLQNFCIINEREVKEEVLWGKYLIYAVAMGLGEVVNKSIEIAIPSIKTCFNSNEIKKLL